MSYGIGLVMEEKRLIYYEVGMHMFFSFVIVLIPEWNSRPFLKGVVTYYEIGINREWLVLVIILEIVVRPRHAKLCQKKAPLRKFLDHKRISSCF
jgi:hypothetical protein